jgi:two-component sensor histidine kinase
LDTGTLATFLNAHPTESICVDLEGIVRFANASAERMLAQSGSSIGTNFFDLFEEPTDDLREKIMRCVGSDTWQPISATLSSGSHDGMRLALRCRGMPVDEDGSLLALITTDENRRPMFHHHRDLIRSLNAELAEQREIRIRLDAALENETRLHQELIHRVKNNLMLLTSLIRTRGTGSDDPAVRAALSDIQARVLSIGLVHELLDQNKQIDVVDAEELLEKLSQQMENSICPPGVTIKRDLTPYKLHVSEATPLALLVNELVTNSLKHAFTGRDNGQIEIALRRNGVDKIEIHVADDGAGYAAAEGGHGSRIVEALASQLDGDISVRSENGTSWQLIFAPSEVGKSSLH